MSGVAYVDEQEHSDIKVQKISVMRKVTCALAFLVLAVVLFAYLNLAFVIKGSQQSKGTFDAFYNLPENTVDVMYIGTSATSRFFVNPIAYHENGIASYSFGAPNTPVYFIRYLMQEAEATQDPSLYVIELRGTRKAPADISESFVRTTLDTINLLSPNRIPMAQAAEKYCTNGESNAFEYLVPIVKYHNRLLQGDMKPDDFMLKVPKNRTQGFCTSKMALSQVPQKRASFTDEIGELDSESVGALEELFDYCKGTGKDVLFVLAPCSTSKSMSKSMNAVAQLVKDRGYHVLNCNTYDICDEMGLDWETDFYNKHHTNYLGAEKYTRYFAKYLSENYDLPDRRGDSRYEAWEAGYDYYKGFTEQGIKYADAGTGEEGEV